MEGYIDSSKGMIVGSTLTCSAKGICGRGDVSSVTFAFTFTFSPTDASVTSAVAFDFDMEGVGVRVGNASSPAVTHPRRAWEGSPKRWSRRVPRQKFSMSAKR
jgi:hypothetical protein